MGILDGIRSYFRDDGSDLTEQAAALDRQRRGDQFGDLPDEMEDMPPEEVADTFARMEQETRLTFMRKDFISEDKWNEMRSMIRNDSEQREFWGIDGSQTVFREGVEVCACHEEGLNPLTEIRENQETFSQTQGTSESSKTEVGGKMGGSGGTGIPGVGNMKATGEGSAKKGWTHGETQQEMAQVTGTTGATRTFHACRVEPTNSTVSRRAFLQAGSFHMGHKYNRNADNTQSAINNWTSTTETTSTQQEQSQKGIDTLRSEKNKIVNKIENLDENIDTINEDIDEVGEDLDKNKRFKNQNARLMDENEASIEKRQTILDERERLREERNELREEREELREKKEDTLAKKKQLRSQKHELQNRIEDHEEYEEAQEANDTTESVTQDADDTATEDTAESEDEAASEAADDTAHDSADETADTESEQATETTTAEQTTDGTPESDGGPPDDTSGSDDRGGDPETETESTTVNPRAEPVEARAEAAAANRSTPDDNDSDQSEETETNPTVSDGAIADRLTGTNPSNGEGTGTTNSTDNHDEERKGPGRSSP